LYARRTATNGTPGYLETAMHIVQDLPRLIQTLAAIDDAGWLDDLQADVAAASRGPRVDLDRWPWLRPVIERYARVAARLLDLPLAECRAAATEALLPRTRRRAALDAIEKYRQRLDEQTTARFAGRTTRRGGRRG
jgi:hypothetical protein